MGSLGEILPKGLLPCCNSNLIDYLLNAMDSLELSPISIGVGWLKDELIRYLLQLDRPELRIVDVEEYEVGPLQTLVSTVGDALDDWYLISPVDSLLNISILKEMVSSMSSEDAIAYLAVDSEASRGTPVCLDSNENIESVGPIESERHPDARSAMLLGASKKFIEICKDRLEKGYTRVVDVLNYVISLGEVIKPLYIKDDWLDIDTITDLIHANQKCIDEQIPSEWALLIPQDDQMEFGETLVFENDTVIHAGTRLIGPVLISQGCKIMSDVILGPNVSISSGCSVSEKCVLSNAIVAGNSHIVENVHLSNVVVYKNNVYGSSDSFVSE